MLPDLKYNSGQDSFLDAARLEISAGNEDLNAWIRQLRSQGGLESLFELETWLKGIRSFFNIAHLALSDSEKNTLVTRTFAPEIALVRQAIQRCDSCACALMGRHGAGRIGFEEFIQIQMRGDRMPDLNIGHVAEQATPRDSISHLLEFLNDVRITIDAFHTQPAMNYRLFRSLGRSFCRELRNCRYVDLLINQKFRVHYDFMNNWLPARILHPVSDETVRRNVALALVQLFRFLKCLNIVSVDLGRDHPLKQNLIIFSLLHEEMGALADFLKNRFLRSREVGIPLRKAAELVAYSLKIESQRVLERELVSVAHERDPEVVFVRIENSQGLLQNCCQSCVTTLVQAADNSFDVTGIFASRGESLAAAERVRQNLWELRQWLADVLANREELDTNKIGMRINAFRDEFLHALMYRDWAEFDAFLDAMALAGNFIEVRVHIRKFAGFLETLIQEVSKRSVFQDKTENFPSA